MKKRYLPIFLQLTLYVIQYIIMPKLINIYPSDVHTHLLIIGSTTILVSIVGMIFFSNSLRYWLLGWALYIVMVCLYHPAHIYGINYGILSKFISILGWAIIILIIEFAIWAIIKIIKYILNNTK